MGTIRKNALSNIATKLWNMISIYIFIPFYIKFLGGEAYGIVSFFATMQTAINLLGLGLSNTLRREFAVVEDEKNGDYRKHKLLKGIEIIYWFIALFISGICLCFSRVIAEHWLNIGEFEPNYISNVIFLMGISIALQMVANLYAGCLFGLDYQIEANLYCIVWSILKSCGSVFIVWLLSPDLRIFYGWHIVTDCLYVLVLRISIKIKLKTDKNCKWTVKDFKILKGIWRYAFGILIISFVALINKQLDKIIISNLLSLTELGAYNLATTLGSLTTIFATAMYISVFPTFTNYVTSSEKPYIEQKFLSVNRLTNIVTACIGAYVAVFAIPLIELWTQSDIYSEMLQMAAPLVVMAVAFTEFQEIPYALALAHGNTKINVLMGIAYIPFVCIITWFGIKKLGLVGAGSAYLVVMFSQTLIYEYAVYKKYLKTGAFRLILSDTIIPVLLSVASSFITFKTLRSFVVSNIVLVFGGILLGAITLVLLIFIFEKKLIIDFFLRIKSYFRYR